MLADEKHEKHDKKAIGGALGGAVTATSWFSDEQKAMAGGAARGGGGGIVHRARYGAARGAGRLVLDADDAPMGFGGLAMRRDIPVVADAHDDDVDSFHSRNSRNSRSSIGDGDGKKRDDSDMPPPPPPPLDSDDDEKASKKEKTMVRAPCALMCSRGLR